MMNIFRVSMLRWHMVLTGFFLAVVLLGSVGCRDKDGGESNKLKVVSTTGMIHDIVKEVGGESVSAIGLMGPGVDPHLYKASEGDVRKLSEADVIFYNGLHLEAKMGDILKKMGRRTRVAEVTSGIDRSRLKAPPEYEGFYDPHVWFDVSFWVSAVDVVADQLVKADSEGESGYRQRALDYRKKLMDLHQEVLRKAARVPKEQRILVTAHDAFGYFGEAYGFQVRGLQGISTETEAGTKDVQALVAFIVTHKVPTIFVESSVPQRHIQAVQAAVRSKGWDVEIGEELFADALGDAGTPEGTYIGMVRHNIEAIVHGLTRER